MISLLVTRFAGFTLTFFFTGLSVYWITYLSITLPSAFALTMVELKFWDFNVWNRNLDNIFSLPTNQLTIRNKLT